MQLPLLNETEPWTTPVGRLHYVPALLDRPGEREALRHADPGVWSRMTPLIQEEVATRKGADPSRHAVRSSAQRLRTSVGTRPVYIDVMPSESRRLAAPARTVALVYEEMSRTALNFVPVHRAGAAGLAPVIAAVAASQGNGAALRWMALEPLVLGTQSVSSFLRGELELLGVAPADADLIVDLTWLDPGLLLPTDDATAIVDWALSAAPWRSVVVTGTSIPRSLGSVPEGTLGRVERREWDIWNALPSDAPVRFGDYGVQHPRSPYAGRGGPMRANLRYTTETSTLLARGVGALNSMPPEERANQYRELCRWIVDEPTFGGHDCCWGDAVIEDCAFGRRVPGSQEMWRGAGTSHHLRVVTRALDQAAARHAAKDRVPTPPTSRRERAGRVAGTVPLE